MTEAEKMLLAHELHEFISAAPHDYPGRNIELFERVEAALLAPSNSWELLETAPIGSTYNDQILVGFMGQFAWYSFVAWPNGAETRLAGHAKPTHWMPIPPGPKDDSHDRS